MTLSKGIGGGAQQWEKWKDRKLPAGSAARQRFDELCRPGWCDQRMLFAFLVTTVHFAARKQTSFEVYGVSPKDLAKLSDDLDRLSKQIESVEPFLRHYLEVAFVEKPSHANDLSGRARLHAALAGNQLYTDDLSSRARLRIAAYKKTPELLRLLSQQLRLASSFTTKVASPKKWDTRRDSIVKLLEYVESCTKSPHYQHVAELIDHLSPAPDGSVTDAGALRLAFHRAGVRGYRNSRRNAS